MTPLIESEEKELTNEEEKAKAEAVAKSAAAAAASTAEKVAEKAAKAAQEEIKKAEVKKEEKGGGEDKCKVEIARKADILAGWLGMHKGYALAVLFCHYVKLGLSHDAETAWELLEEEERER
jgi:hypothetical protein